MEHAIGVIDAIEIVIHLGAERAARERMRGIAGQSLGLAITNLDDPAARVGAVVPACAADDVDGRDRQRHGVDLRVTHA